MTNLTYDANGNLTCLDSPGDGANGRRVVTSTYGDGLRAWQESGEVTTYYVYDGDTLVAELAGETTTISVWGADGLISRGDVFYLYDPLGNVVHRLNHDGSVRANDVYDAWATCWRARTRRATIIR